MKFVVESTGITYRLPVLVAPPKCRRRRLAVRTARARSSGRTLETLYKKTEKELSVSQDHHFNSESTHVTGVNLLSDLIG